MLDIYIEQDYTIIKLNVVRRYEFIMNWLI